MKTAYTFAGVGIFLFLISAILYLCKSDYYGLISSTSTLISIILGVFSIAYTFFSGKKAQETLDEIRRQNDALVRKINYELSKNNFDEENLEGVRMTIKK